MLKVLDLFSGIGMFGLGLERTGGFEVIAHCENDPFASRVLEKHWPDVPNLGDVTKAEFPYADVVVGGFPCQDVSHAGKRAGLPGARSGLYRELVRAIRLVRPKYAIVENVAALLGDGLDTVLGDVAQSGFDAEWDCVPAKALGAPHERDRVWIVAHADGVQGRERSDAPIQRGRQDETKQAGLGAGRPEQPTDPQSIGCGQGWPRRPPDSFARVRVAARWNASNPASKGLEGRQEPETARGPLTELAGGYCNPWRSWTDESEISRMDDGDTNWVDRTRCTGNSLLPQIPELIGRAILEAERGYQK